MPDIIPENYNSENLVKIWREFIDWDKRRLGEDGFLKKQFSKYGVKKVFDSCLGGGCDSIYLIKQGFEVVSNEIDKLFIEQALKNAKGEGLELKVTNFDWRELDQKFESESFDAVICLGNSITYLFEEKDRIETINQFKRLLRPGGILIIDERNYQYILDNREDILSGNFKYSGKYVYCGHKVHGKPIEISDKHVKMEYVHEDIGTTGYLILYPFKTGELRELLNHVGFSSIQQFRDYKTSHDTEADFYQYICVK